MRIPVERNRIAAGGDRERALGHDSAGRLVKHVARIRLLLVADARHERSPVTATLGLACDAHALLHHPARLRLDVEASARTDADRLAARSGQRLQQRLRVVARVDRVRPHGLVGQAARAADLVRRLPRGRREDAERLGVERDPRGAHRLAHGPRVELRHERLARPAAARLRVEGRDAARTEAAVRLADAHAQVIVKPVRVWLGDRQDRLREIALEIEHSGRAGAEEVDTFPVSAHLPGVVGECTVARLWRAVVRRAVAKRQPLLVRKPDARLLAERTERRELCGLLRDQLVRLPPAAREPELVARARIAPMALHQTLEHLRGVVDRARVADHHERPFSGRSGSRCQQRKN